MSTTEGVGGPCPLCGEENCYIRTGTGTWFTFIACPDCLFAYGENDDAKGQGRFGQVTGADVWSSILRSPNRETISDSFDTLRNADHHDMESPFNFDDMSESDLITWRIDDTTLHEVYEGIPEIWEQRDVKVVESVDSEEWTWSDTQEEPTDGDNTMTEEPDTAEVNRTELATVIDEAEDQLHLYEGEYRDELETAIISLRQELEVE
jgi:hypothetical protein